jgi:hypothetical protein
MIIKKVIDLNNPCKLLQKHFVTISIYGCEAWGLFKTNFQGAIHYENL